MDKNRMFKYLPFLFGFSLLFGCATHNESRQKMEESLPEHERAYLIGKYSIQCSPNPSRNTCAQSFNSMSVYYQSAGGMHYSDIFDFTSGGMFGGDTVADHIDLEAGEKSFYFCRILPAGAYNLFSIRYWNFAGGGSGYTLRKEDQFDVPFHLEAGKVSNIDHLSLTVAQGKNAFGMSLPMPGGLEISSLSEGEVEQALERCPENARSLEVTQQLLWKKTFESPFVTTKN